MLTPPSRHLVWIRPFWRGTDSSAARIVYVCTLFVIAFILSSVLFYRKLRAVFELLTHTHACTHFNTYSFVYFELSPHSMLSCRKFLLETLCERNVFRNTCSTFSNILSLPLSLAVLVPCHWYSNGVLRRQRR